MVNRNFERMYVCRSVWAVALPGAPVVRLEPLLFLLVLVVIRADLCVVLFVVASVRQWRLDVLVLEH